MKIKPYIFLYLNIYTAFFCTIYAQQISLTIDAEKEITSEILKTISPITEFNNYNALELETNRILEVFQKEGFIESRLITITKEPVSINSEEKTTSYIARYYIGQRISTITIYFDPENFSKKEISQIIPKTKEDFFILPFSEVENILSKLNELQTKKGDAFGKTYLTSFSINGDKISARLISETTKIRTIDSIIIKGYEKFPKSYLKYIAGVKKNTVFNSNKISKANVAINALPFASSTKDPEVLFKEEKTALYFYLSKQKSNNFDGIIGFSTDETTNKLIFNGYLDLQLNNNLNFGETLLLNYKSDGNDQINFKVLATLPYILKSPVGIDLGLSIFKQAENFSTTSQQAGLRYQINPNAIVALQYANTTSTILTDTENTPLDLEEYTKNEVTAITQWKFYQNDELFPVKSTFGLLAGIGNKVTSTTNDQQYRLGANASYIVDLNSRNSFFVANESMFLQSDTYAINELYRIGGINSIRGFKENAIEASIYSFINTEYRYRFTNTLYMHSIVDVGYLENQVSKTNSTLYSFGFGAGFFTRTGLLKISLANGKIENQDFRFSDVKIHLSLVSSF